MNGMNERTAMDIYISELSRAQCDSLEMEEELSLLARAADGDRKAMRRIVEANLRFVVSVAKKYARRGGAELEDLVQAGSLALYESFATFDYGKFVRSGCCRFASYAGMRVAQKIAMEASAHSLSAPVCAVRAAARLEFSEGQKISEKRARTLANARERAVSLDAEDSDGRRVSDFASDPREDPARDAVMSICAQNLSGAMRSLPQVERDVLDMAYGLSGEKPMNYPAIGRELGYTREGVRLVHNRAVRHLREMMGLAA